MPHFIWETLLIYSSAHTAGNGKAKKHLGGERKTRGGKKPQITLPIHLKVRSQILQISFLSQPQHIHSQHWVQSKTKVHRDKQQWEQRATSFSYKTAPYARQSIMRLVSISSLPSGSLPRALNALTLRKGNWLLFHHLPPASCVPSRSWVALL